MPDADHEKTDTPKGSVLLNEGGTVSERHLARLARTSFLSLWSYPTPYRGDDRKELCDLLVIFENDVVIFSDKDCEFTDSGNLKVDWARWYRKALKKSASQTHGAERWLRANTGGLYLDPNAERPFPIALPSPDKARYHKVLVAHGAAERCKRELGGSGSLIIVPGIVGDSHQTGTPFEVGQVDPAWGYMHVFDDTSLDIVLQTLDTISDFVAYLRRKEAFVQQGKLQSAAGEQELLAEYLTRLGPDGEHDFVFKNEGPVVLGAGHWDKFKSSPQRVAQIQANEISYSWDELIEKFAYHMTTETLDFSTGEGLSHHEPNVRWLARENRTRRRLLSEAIHELVFKTDPNGLGARVMYPSSPGDPFYVFLLVPPTWDKKGYRELRREILYKYCMTVKLKWPEAAYIVGLATESGYDIESRSEDAIGFDCSVWTTDMQAEAEAMQAELPVLETVRRFEGKVREYPEVRRIPSIIQHPPPRPFRKIGRNELCPCGSGTKYKRCCGR